jgi:hypothetical protein
MGKSRNDAANILLANGWKFEEIEAVLTKKKPPSKPPNKIRKKYKEIVI